MINYSPRFFRPRHTLLAVALMTVPSLFLFAENPAPTATSTTRTATAPAPRPATDRDKERERKRQEEIERTMEFFRVTQPDVWEQARVLREKDPAKFEETIRKAADTVNTLQELKRKNPKLYELNLKDFELYYKSLRLAKSLKAPDLSAADKTRMTAELAQVLTDQFDNRQKIRQLQIDEQAQKLKELENQLKEREKIKAQLIKKRVDDLLEKPPRLEW